MGGKKIDDKDREVLLYLYVNSVFIFVCLLCLVV